MRQYKNGKKYLSFALAGLLCFGQSAPVLAQSVGQHVQVRSLLDFDNDLGISVEDRLAGSVAMVVGNNHALVDNQKLSIPGAGMNAPINRAGDLLVPLQFVGEGLGIPVTIQGEMVEVKGRTMTPEEMAQCEWAEGDILVPLELAGTLLGKYTYTDYRGRGLVVIGDNPMPFDDSKESLEENVAPQDNEKFYIEEAIKTIVYTRPTGNEVMADFEEANKAHPRMLATTSDFARVKAMIKAGDPLMNKWYGDIKQLGETQMKLPLPTDDLPDGVRMISSRQVGPLVTNLSMLYHLSDDETEKAQYKERIWQEVYAVSQFPNWNEKKEFLNTAEFMEGLALAYDWMYEEWTPEQRSILEKAMIEKGLVKALEAYDQNVWWTHTYPRTNNWNAVCNGSVILTVLAIGDTQHEITLSTGETINLQDLGAKLIDTALNALEDFILLEFTPDGAWAEGPSYWEYTLEYLVRFMSSLDTAIGKTYGYDETPGLSRTAYFPAYLSGPVASLNYGDASSNKVRAQEVLWLATQYGDKRLTSIHLDQKDQYKFSGSEFEMLWYVPENYESGHALELDQYFRGTEVATLRSDWKDPNATFVGVKSGSNVVSHGQYDLGSFVVESLGQQWAIDLGKDDYNLPGYFDYAGKRLEYYRLNPEGHNTLVINPSEVQEKPVKPQQDIMAFAKIEKYESKPLGAYTITNLTDAYEENGAVEARRGIMLTDDRTRITVQDEVTLDAPSTVYWFMHTEAQIALSEDGKSAVLSKGGEELWVGLDSDADAVFEVMDAKPLPGSPNPPKQNQNAGIRKLAIKLENVTDFTLAVNMVPVTGTLEEVNTDIETIPLDSWTLPEGELIAPVLEGMTVDGQALPGFEEEVFAYKLDYPLNTSEVPQVEVQYDEKLYNVSVIQAADIPGVAQIIVSSKHNSAIKRIYKVNFNIIPGEGQQEELQQLPVVAVEASASQEDKGNTPDKAIDGIPSTYWGAEGDQWIQLDLGEVQSINSVAISFIRGNERSFKYDIATSKDGIEWYGAYTGASSGETLDLEYTYLKKHEARYVRITGHGNSANKWNSYGEIKIYTLPPQNEGAPTIKVTGTNAHEFTNKESVEVSIQAKGDAKLTGIEVYKEGSLLLEVPMETVLSTTTGSAITLEWDEVTTDSALQVELPEAKAYGLTQKTLNLDLTTEGWGDGTYQIIVTDSFDNQSERTFYADRTAPQVIGVEDGAAYRKKVTGEVMDENLYTVTLNGETVAPEFEAKQKGSYQLIATDKAGNETKISFTIKAKEYIPDDSNSQGGSNGSAGQTKPEEPKKEDPKKEDHKEETELIEVKFEDIQHLTWAEDSIIFLAERGIIKGINETQFGPKETLTTVDFERLLYRVLGLEEKELENNQTPITREDMIHMTIQMLEEHGHVVSSQDTETLKFFKDYEAITQTHLQSLATAYEVGLIQGDGQHLRPGDSLTRAESAVFLRRVFEKIC